MTHVNSANLVVCRGKSCRRCETAAMAYYGSYGSRQRRWLAVSRHLSIHHPSSAVTAPFCTASPATWLFLYFQVLGILRKVFFDPTDPNCNNADRAIILCEW